MRSGKECKYYELAKDNKHDCYCNYFKCGIRNACASCSHYETADCMDEDAKQASIPYTYNAPQLKYNKGEKIMKDKIKQAVTDEFKYRASQGRTNYSMEEVIYIVNEVIDEVNFEENKVIPEAQFIDVDVQIRIIKGDLRYLSEKVDKLSSFIEEQKITR